jgi:hypothetical protein
MIYFTSAEILIKVVFSALDILNIGWAIYGLALYTTQIDNQWIECKSQIRLITLFIPIISTFILLSTPRIFLNIIAIIHSINLKKKM